MYPFIQFKCSGAWSLQLSRQLRRLSFCKLPFPRKVSQRKPGTLPNMHLQHCRKVRKPRSLTVQSQPRHATSSIQSVVGYHVIAPSLAYQFASTQAVTQCLHSLVPSPDRKLGGKWDGGYSVHQPTVYMKPSHHSTCNCLCKTELCKFPGSKVITPLQLNAHTKCMYALNVYMACVRTCNLCTQIHAGIKRSDLCMQCMPFIQTSTLCRGSCRTSQPRSQQSSTTAISSGLHYE